jgi:hypothetical protein
MNSSSCCKECIEQHHTLYSVERNHINCLKYLHEQKYPWHPHTTWGAASYNSLDCLIYAHEHGCPWHPYTTWVAAMNGYLECLKYAHEHGCVWDMETTKITARNGQLDCLIYAHENGCPWDIETIYEAAKNGHIDCVLYAYRNGAQFNNYDANYVKDKFGITLETPQTITDTKTNTSNDTVHNNNELNNMVDMHLDQINQMETTLHNAKDNFLTLKKNYESLQQDFYSMKKAYGEKCEEINKVNDICEKMTLKLENISNLEIQLNANNEMIKSLQKELEHERLKNEKIMLSIKSIIY